VRACAGSVYNLIKKELVSLRVDSNTLVSTVNALAHGQQTLSAAQAQSEALREELESVRRSISNMGSRTAHLETSFAVLEAQWQSERAAVQRVRHDLCACQRKPSNLQAATVYCQPLAHSSHFVLNCRAPCSATAVRNPSPTALSCRVWST
jgi:chromosome segregation ATPase